MRPDALNAVRRAIMEAASMFWCSCTAWLMTLNVIFVTWHLSFYILSQLWRTVCEVLQRNLCEALRVASEYNTARAQTLGRSQHSQRPCPTTVGVCRSQHTFSAAKAAKAWSDGPAVPLYLQSTAVLDVFPSRQHKGYIIEEDMEEIIECYSGQALVKEELSKVEV